MVYMSMCVHECVVCEWVCVYVSVVRMSMCVSVCVWKSVYVG